MWQLTRRRRLVANVRAHSNRVSMIAIAVQRLRAGAMETRHTARRAPIVYRVEMSAIPASPVSNVVAHRPTDHAELLTASVRWTSRTRHAASVRVPRRPVSIIAIAATRSSFHRGTHRTVARAAAKCACLPAIIAASTKNANASIRNTNACPDLALHSYARSFPHRRQQTPQPLRRHVST